MWKLEAHPQFVKKLSKWPKKHRREITAMIDNLDTLFAALCQGTRVEQAKRQLGFVHGKYPCGIVSVDQRGGGGGLKQTRLYAYPDEGANVLYQLTLGDKDSQPADVQFCAEWVEDHLRKRG